MRSEYEATVDYNIERNKLIEQIKRTLTELNWKYQYANFSFEAEVEGALRSFGEIITIVVNDNSFVIKSRCLRFQLTAWGKNKDNVLNFVGLLRQHIN